MNNNTTYQLLAAFLSLVIFTGTTLPTGLHLQSLNMCDTMQADMDMHSGHNMPAAMEHSEAHDFGFACACSIEEAPIKTEAPVFQKVKSQVLAVVQVLNDIQKDPHSSETKAIPVSDSYSPPPIFLANESFLI